MDSSFKRLFGVDECKPYLLSFLNDLYEGELVIRDIEFINKEIIPEFDYEKMMIYDIYCRTDKNEEIIIEMQNKVSPAFKNRSLFYIVDSIHRQGRRGGDWNYDIKAVYGIFFLNEKMKDVDKLVKHVGLTDIEDGKMFNNKMRLTYISLPEMTKSKEECGTAMEKWIYVLKNLEELDMIPFKDQLKGLEEFEARARYHSMTEKERAVYDRNLKIYRDNVMIMKDAEQKGIEKGILESARKFIQSGISRMQVKQILGLSDADMATL